jgi:hypothetical protein
MLEDHPLQLETPNPSPATLSLGVLEEDPGDLRQLFPTWVSPPAMPWQSSAQASDGVDTRRAVTDNPRVMRRRRQSSPRDGGSEDAGKHGHFLRGRDY